MTYGLQHLHNSGQGYKHCDIAARNYLLTEKEEMSGSDGIQCLVLADFGLARPFSHQFEFGRPIPWRHCAPEVLSSGGEKTNVRTDMWQLGVAFWELLGIKQVPFHIIKRPQHLIALTQARQSEVPLIFPVWTPNNVKATIQRLCEFDPTKRPTTDEVVEILKDIQYEGPTGTTIKNEMKEDLSGSINDDASESVEYDSYLGVGEEGTDGQDYASFTPQESDSDEDDNTYKDVYFYFSTTPKKEEKSEDTPKKPPAPGGTKIESQVSEGQIKKLFEDNQTLKNDLHELKEDVKKMNTTLTKIVSMLEQLQK